MAEGRYSELVKLYRKAHTTYSSSILSQVRSRPEITPGMGHDFDAPFCVGEEPSEAYPSVPDQRGICVLRGDTSSLVA